MDLIYLDNNATTPMLPAVAEAMRPLLTDVYGNPASAHQAGRRARQALEDARAYMREAPHDFGGHRVEAMRATDEAIRQLRLALAYRAEEDREHRR